MDWIKLILFCTLPIAWSQEFQNHASKKLVRKRRNTEQGRIDEANSMNKDKLKFHVHFLPKPKEKLNAPRRVPSKLIRPITNPLIRPNDVAKTITPDLNNKDLTSSSKEADTKNITSFFVEESDEVNKFTDHLKPITKIDNSEFRLEVPTTEIVNVGSKKNKKINNTVEEDYTSLEKDLLAKLPKLIEALLGAKEKHEHHTVTDLDTSSEVTPYTKIDHGIDILKPTNKKQEDGVKMLLLQTINKNAPNETNVVKTQEPVKTENTEIISIKQHNFTEVIESREATHGLAFEDPVVNNVLRSYDKQTPTSDPYTNTYGFRSLLARPNYDYNYQYLGDEDTNGFVNCEGTSPEKIRKSWVNTEVVIKSAKPVDFQTNPQYYPQMQTRRSLYNNYCGYGNPNVVSYPAYPNPYYGMGNNGNYGTGNNAYYGTSNNIYSYL